MKRDDVPDSPLEQRWTEPAGPPRLEGSAAGRGLTVVDPGHYERGAEIGRGGMGRITSAVDRRLDREVALKEATSGDAAVEVRFEREALITARLMHPAIVPVYEAGRWPDGGPFYAMKRVEGRSLQEVIDGARTTAERLALVRHVIAVSEALAYAHARRVIHRDLKPGNVLVGELGETVVIDWGVAKELGTAEGSQPAEAAADDRLTIAGSAVGTPAYMAPEQARGEPLDERGDVYALGALLYQVLTGRAPYAGPRALEDVLRGPPPAIESLAPDAPGELMTIARKAMARAPADRYPSARELAQELRRFEAGQLVRAHAYSGVALLRRWLRRHRAVVSVAAVLLAALAVTGVVSVRRIVVEKARADDNARQARAERDAAEQLVEFSVSELRDRLNRLGRLDLMAGVGEEVERYYRDLAAGGAGLDAHARRRRARAAVLIGDVTMDRGDLAAARRSYDEAVAALDPLEPAADPQILAALSYALVHRAAAQDSLGEAARAVADAKRALEVAERIPANAEGADRDRAEAHRRLGRILLERDSGDADPHLQAQLRLRERVAAQAPGDLQARQAVATAHDDLAAMYEGHGDFTSQTAELERALATYAEVLATDPSNSRIDEYMVQSQLKLGFGHQRLGDLDRARADFTAGVARAEKLVKLEPGSRERRSEWARANSYLGNVSLLLGDVAAAQAAVTTELQTYEELVAAAPKNAFWVNMLGLAHKQLGEVREATHDSRGALEQYRATLAIRERLVANEPNNRRWRANLAAMHAQIVEHLLAQGDVAGAFASARRARDLYLIASVLRPTADASWADLGRACRAMAQSLRARGDRRGAEAASREALAIHARIVAGHAEAAYRLELARSREGLAEILGRGSAEAEELRGQALADLEAIGEAKLAAEDKVLLLRLRRPSR